MSPPLSIAKPSLPRWLEEGLTWVGSGYFLGFSLVVSTMTYLRFSPQGLGPTEFLLVAWMLASLRITPIRLTSDVLFLIGASSIVIALACAGWFSASLLPIKPHGLIIRDLVAISASAALSILLYLRVRHDASFLRTMLATILVTAPIAYLAIFRETYLAMFDLEPWWGYRYMGWAHNPNQTALLFVTLPFFALYLFKTEANPVWRRVYALAGLAAAFTGAMTYSHGTRVGWAGALVICFFVFGNAYFQSGKGRSKRRFDLYYGLPLLGLIVISPKILSTIRAINYADGEKGYYRFVLWDHGIASLASSPLFGFGGTSFSGVDSPLGYSESHNGFIDFALMAGPFASLTLMGLTLYLFLRVLRSGPWMLAGGITALIAFTQFGGYFRHPLYWCLLQSFYWLSSPLSGPQTPSRARAPRNASPAFPTTASP